MQLRLFDFFIGMFLPRDAHSVKQGIAVISCPFVRLSVRPSARL